MPEMKSPTSRRPWGIMVRLCVGRSLNSAVEVLLARCPRLLEGSVSMMEDDDKMGDTGRA